MTPSEGETQKCIYLKTSKMDILRFALKYIYI